MQRPCRNCEHFLAYTGLCLRTNDGVKTIKRASSFRENSHHHDTCGYEGKYFLAKKTDYQT
jgi:hypothetical protein